jgi:hypothetical protein
MSGSVSAGGQITIAPGPNSAPPAGSVPIGDAPELGTCASEYKGIYPLGLYDSGSGNHCTNVVPSALNTAYLNALSEVTARNTSGVPGSGTGFIVGMSCQGMSVALAECSSLIVDTNALGSVVASSFNIFDHAVSNNDLDTWFPGGVGQQPTACLTTVTTPTGPAECQPPGGFGPTTNQFDRICTGLSSNGHNCNQIMLLYVDTSNGQVHQYANGCYSTTLPFPGATQALYYLCSPLDGSHAIGDVTKVGCPFGGTDGCPNTSGGTGTGGIDATNTAWGIANHMRAAKSRMPFLAIAFFSSRAYAGYCPTGCADPEPYAYEKALAIHS